MILTASMRSASSRAVSVMFSRNSGLYSILRRPHLTGQAIELFSTSSCRQTTWKRAESERYQCSIMLVILSQSESISLSDAFYVLYESHGEERALLCEELYGFRVRSSHIEVGEVPSRLLFLLGEEAEIVVDILLDLV